MKINKYRCELCGLLYDNANEVIGLNYTISNDGVSNRRIVKIADTELHVCVSCALVISKEIEDGGYEILPDNITVTSLSEHSTEPKLSEAYRRGS